MTLPSWPFPVSLSLLLRKASRKGEASSSLEFPLFLEDNLRRILRSKHHRRTMATIMAAVEAITTTTVKVIGDEDCIECREVGAAVDNGSSGGVGNFDGAD